MKLTELARRLEAAADDLTQMRGELSGEPPLAPPGFGPAQELITMVNAAWAQRQQDLAALATDLTTLADNVRTAADAYARTDLGAADNLHAPADAQADLRAADNARAAAEAYARTDLRDFTEVARQPDPPEPTHHSDSPPAALHLAGSLPGSSVSGHSSLRYSHPVGIDGGPLWMR